MWWVIFYHLKAIRHASALNHSCLGKNFTEHHVIVLFADFKFLMRMYSFYSLGLTHFFFAHSFFSNLLNYKYLTFFFSPSCSLTLRLRSHQIRRYTENTAFPVHFQ